MQSIDAEFYNNKGEYLCPDTDLAQVGGSLFTDSHAFVNQVFFSDSMWQKFQAGGQELAEVESIVSRTQVGSQYVTQFFNPTFYKEKGFNKYIAAEYFSVSLKLDDMYELWVGLQQVECSFFDFIWLDVSQFPFYDGHDCTYYKTAEVEEEKSHVSYTSDTMPVYSQILWQDRAYFKVKWTITSFNMVFSMMGGFIGLVWALLRMLLGGYEAFRFNTALAGQIYRTTD